MEASVKHPHREPWDQEQPVLLQVEYLRNLCRQDVYKRQSLYYYEPAEGGKTGYTVEAQNTLVTYAKQGDTELIAVVLKCNGAQHYVDTKTLFEYGFANYQTVKAFSSADLTQNVAITETYKDKTTTLDTIAAVSYTHLM